MRGFFKKVILLYLFNRLEGGVVSISSIITAEIGFGLVSSIKGIKGKTSYSI